MQRKAILIDSSNAVAGKPLPGAAQDMENWREFLKSDIGGMWEDDEFADISSCPKWDDVLAGINTFCVSDGEPYYLFIAFSGHGAYDKYRNADVVSLNHDEVIPVDKLRCAVDAATKNAVIIIDACREEKEYVSSTPINDFTSKGYDWNVVLESLARPSLAKPLFEGVSNSATANLLCNEEPELRSTYLKDVKESWKNSLDESGPVLIQSCSKGEFANEQGCGIFSRAVVEYARSWAHVHNLYDILNISEAFNGTCKLFQQWIANYNSNAEQKVKQTPQISTTSTNLPFSINIKKIDKEER